jgi:outer membrane lipoprotein SlyB
MARMTPILLLPVLALAACRPSYSPDDYATNAVQQMNRVEQAVIIGQRRVTVTAEGATGAATGGAAGGIVGSQAGGGNMTGAIGAVGGALVGGLFGAATERVAGNTTAVEYIVRKTNGDLLSVTQRDEIPLAIGERVLVIAGAQARIVPDYTQTLPAPAPTAAPPAGMLAPGLPPAEAAPPATAPVQAPQASQPVTAPQAPEPAATPQVMPPAS